MTYHCPSVQQRRYDATQAVTREIRTRWDLQLLPMCTSLDFQCATTLLIFRESDVMEKSDSSGKAVGNNSEQKGISRVL